MKANVDHLKVQSSPLSNMFKHLQIRRWVKANSLSRRNSQSFNTSPPSSRGRTAAFYNIPNRCPEYEITLEKHKGEPELNCSYDDADCWFEQALTFLDFFLHKVKNNIPSMCQKCKLPEESLLQIWHGAVLWLQDSGDLLLKEYSTGP